MHKFPKLGCISAAISAILLSGCGGSGDGNSAPTFNQATYSFELNEDTSFSNSVVASDRNASDTLSYTLADAPENGTLTVSANGAITYVPVANFSGSDSATVSVSDGSLSATATINFTVTAVNDAPVINSVNTVISSLTTLTGSIVASDVEGDTLSYSISVEPTTGKVEIDQNDGSFVYTAQNVSSVSDKFTVLVSDGTASTTEEVQLSASFSTNQQKSDYYYANSVSNLVQSEALLVNDEEENDPFVEDDIAAAGGFEEIALAYGRAGFVDEAIALITSKISALDVRAKAFDKLADELNTQANNLSSDEVKSALIQQANTLRQTAVAQMNEFSILVGLENLGLSNTQLYRDVIRGYVDVNATDEARGLLTTLESFAERLESHDAESTPEFRFFLIAFKELMEELTEEYLLAPSEAKFDNAFIVLQSYANLTDKLSYNENGFGKYHSYRSSYYSSVVQLSHLLTLAAQGEQKSKAEMLAKTYLAKALALYANVQYDDDFSFELDQYAATTTSRFPAGLQALTGPFAALYPSYIAANATESLTGNIPLDLVIAEEVKLTDRDIEQGYRDHFAYSMLLNVQNNQSVTPIMTEMSAFFSEQSTDEEYIVETLTEQDANNVIDKRGAAWLLHYAGYKEQALNMVDEAVSVMQTESYKEDVRYSRTYLVGSQGCYQMKALYLEFGGEQTGVDAIDTACSNIITSDFALGAENSDADDTRYTYSALAIAQGEKRATADALVSAKVAIEAAATQSDFDDFIEEHFHVANSMVKAGLLTDSLQPVTSALTRITKELSDATEQEAKLDVLEDALNALELLTERDDDEKYFDIGSYLYGIKHHAGTHSDYATVRAQAETKVVGALNELKAVIDNLPAGNVQDRAEFYPELVKQYAAIGEYDIALSIAQLDSFTQADKEPMLIELAKAQASHDDFPATSTALIDTDKDGLPTFFLTVASQQDITNSGLTADQDSDGDGVSDENDLTPLTPNP